MEDILELYCRAYDDNIPVVCMDEQPVQLIEETRVPLSTSKGCVLRYDYEYKRNGTVNNYMFTEVLAGWRKVVVKERKTMIDWAHEIRDLLEIDYPDKQKVILVCDNLNTHSIGALYEAFPAKEARKLVERLEIHYTPKHGSWLNIAEIELSVLTQQCLKRRIHNIEQLRKETLSWANTRNLNQKSVDWQFKTTDARIKLKRLYPQF